MAIINKIKLNDTVYDINGSTFYGVCTTSGSASAKTATVNTTEFSLYTGVTVVIKFNNANTATAPTLNINTTGNISIYYNGAAIPSNYLKANTTYQFLYDGTYW